MWQAGELLDRLDDLQEDVARADFADDVTGARRAIDAHADINKRLAKVPVDELEAQGDYVQTNCKAVQTLFSKDFWLNTTVKVITKYVRNWKDDEIHEFFFSYVHIF